MASDPTPLRIPAGVPAVLLMGGTFDPPHVAHVAQARAALRRAMAPGAWLVLVPAARSPLKRGGPGARDRDRVAMLRAAFAGVGRATVWTDELDRARGGGGPSYWVETLSRLSRAAPGGAPARVRFLIGSDQAAEFHRWKDPRGVLRLAEPVVVLRPPHRTALGLRRAMARSGFWTRKELDWWMARLVRAPLMDVSATGVRDALRGAAGGEGGEGGLAALPRRVARYVARRGLYRRGGRRGGAQMPMRLTPQST